ncbi:MAG: hypothetical protein CMG55_10015 [Candidatus Marinimicrobia bacterium]|nr:hypothetical protein [Candidatus Neomarinimicrobiota bacterium]|tara:strand:- start:409 stop:933 length:525 start_codon:yes stop_codon:yes gene_type:complete
MSIINIFFKISIIFYIINILSCADQKEVPQDLIPSENIIVTTSNVNTDNIYFDFESNSEVSITDNWQIAIEIDTSNYSMPSFVPGDIYIAIYENFDFDNLLTIPDTYMDDIQNDHSVFGYGGSYEVLSYDISIHKVSVTNPNYIYVIQSGDENYKLQFIEYTSGITVFQYAELE